MESIAVREQSQIAEARRRAATVATGLGGSESAVSNVSIIATELATNLVRHANGGEVFVQPWDDAEGKGIEILALDKGGGMADIAACFEDGFSTAGTPGNGLGAVKRLATMTDVWSRPGMGTALMVRLRLAQAGKAARPPFTWGALCRPIEGETECGDGWGVTYDQDRIAFLVADGLGHGPLAARAAKEAIRIFRDRAMKEPSEGVLQAIHRGIASTRGAAAAIADWRFDGSDLTFSGVGNIAGTVLVNGQAKKTVSMSGTLGHTMRTVRAFSYPAPPGALLVMHSDGLTTSWSLDNYPGLLACHPALIAGVMYRDFRRGRDDATVLVARRAA